MTWSRYCTIWLLLLDCVFCADVCVSVERVQMLTCVFEPSVGCMFGIWGCVSCVLCGWVFWENACVGLEMWASFLRCLQFLRRTYLVKASTMKDRGSVQTCLTTAGVHILMSWSFTRTRCPVYMRLGTACKFHTLMKLPLSEEAG